MSKPLMSDLVETLLGKEQFFVCDSKQLSKAVNRKHSWIVQNIKNTLRSNQELGINTIASNTDSGLKATFIFELPPLALLLILSRTHNKESVQVYTKCLELLGADLGAAKLLFSKSIRNRYLLEDQKDEMRAVIGDDIQKASNILKGALL